MLTRVTVVGGRCGWPHHRSHASRMSGAGARVEVSPSFPNGQRPGPRTGHLLSSHRPQGALSPPDVRRPASTSEPSRLTSAAAQLFKEPRLLMRTQGSLKVTPRFARQATPRSLRSGPGQFLSLPTSAGRSSFRAAASDQRGGPPSLLAYGLPPARTQGGPKAPARCRWDDASRDESPARLHRLQPPGRGDDAGRVPPHAHAAAEAPLPPPHSLIRALRPEVESRHERADEVRPGRGRHPDALGQPAPGPAR